MAKHVIKISPASLSGDQPVFCSYYDVSRRKTFAILQDDTVVENPSRDALLKKVVFTIGQPTLTIEYDDKNKDDNFFKKQADWWKNHPEVIDVSETKPHANFAKARYTYLDMGKQELRESSFLENIGKVMDKLMKAGKAGRQKIATFYGVTGASQLSDGRIIIELADTKSGKLMNQKLIWNQQSGQTYMQHFLEEFKGDSEEVMFRTNIKRAIGLNIIEARTNNPRNKNEITYYVNNQPIASNEDGLAVYLRENADLYETHIIARLDADKKSKKEESDNQLKVNKSGMEENERRLYAKDLQIRGWNQLAMNQLNELIEAEEKKRGTQKEEPLEVDT